jgi:hypothetical protein
MRFPRTLRLVPLALLAALSLAPGAAAGRGDDPFGDVPAIGAYVEDIPSAGGRRESTSATSQTVRTLRPAVERRLSTEDDVGAKLREVATSSRYGATALAPKEERDRVAPLVRGEDAELETADAFGSALTAAEGGAVHLRILLVLLLLSTAAAVALAGYRARTSR